MSARPAVRSEKRVPCASCRQPILEGARKCRHCKAWQPEGPRAPRAALMMFVTVSSVLSVLITAEKSPIEEAPPLTPLAGDRPAASAEIAAEAPAPPGPASPSPPPQGPRRSWTAREIKMGDVHPLDVCFSKSGESVFVSADDATIREYRVDSGEFVHKASLTAKGDRIVLLYGRWLAVLHPEARNLRVPVMDVTKWDHDPIELETGAGPSDAIEMGNGSIVVGTKGGHRISRFALPSGEKLDDITLPQATGQLFVVRSGGRPQLAALGGMTHAGRPAGAWIDLFDPSEAPFGATRRSAEVGRDPRTGAVSSDGGSIFFPDFAANSATWVDIGEETRTRSFDVGQGPVAAFVLAGDRRGVTLNAISRTASVVDLTAPVDRPSVATLMLAGEPRAGRLSPDRSTLFVALGGREDPPRGQGVAVIAGDPPEVITTLETGAGAAAIGVSADGARAAVANYFSKSITILE